jgi:hypothetical protein
LNFRQLQKQRLKISNSIALRDSIRNEVAKQKLIQDEMKDIEEQQKMNINSYNNIVNSNEKDAIRLRKRYDDCVKERNNRGIEFITRSEEVCVISERANAQENIITNGNIELQAREQEIKFLKLTLEEEKRQLGLLVKEVPNEEALQHELEILRQQVRVFHYDGFNLRLNLLRFFFGLKNSMKITKNVHKKSYK